MLDAVRSRRLRIQARWLLVSIVLITLTAGIGGAAALETRATVWTDKLDYAPGETVLISGVGFPSEATLVVQVQRPRGVDLLPVTCDSQGSFTLGYELSPDRAMSGTYTVLVVEPATSSVLATTTFTDAPTTRYGITILRVNGYLLGEMPETITNPVELSGVFNITNGAGQVPNQYGVRIDWGDGNYTMWTYSDTNHSWPYLTWEILGDKDANGTFNTNPLGAADLGHNYATAGNYTITVRLFHGQWKGAESDDSAHQITVRVVPKYTVIFTQTGLDSSATGTVVTITVGDGSPVTKTLAELPFNVTVEGDTSISYAYTEPVPSNEGRKRFRLDSVTGPASPLTVSASTTVTGNYRTQYSLTLETNPAGVSIPSGAGWYDANTYAPISTAQTVDIVTGASRYNFTGWATGDMSEIVNPGSPSTTVLMDRGKTVTANYATQYLVAFAQTGVGSDYAGTVVTVDGTGYSRAVLPASFWWNKDSSHGFAFGSTLTVGASKQYLWNSTSGLSTLQSGLITASGSGSVSGNYNTQYNVTVTASPSAALGATFKVTYTQLGITYAGVTRTTQWTDWADEGTTVTVSEPEPYRPSEAGQAGVRYRFDSYTPSASVTMTEGRTIALVYRTQCSVTFAQTGLDSSATGAVVVTVDSVAKTYDELPATKWIDADGQVTYLYAALVSSSGPRKQFVLLDVTGPSSPINVTKPATVTGNYRTQYQVTFRAEPSEGGSTNPAGTNWYYAGDQSIAATPNSGYEFWTWTTSTPSISIGNPSLNSTTATINGPGNVTASFNATISMSLQPTSGSVQQGGSVQTTATIAGGAQSVMLDITGLPQGATASWSQNPVINSPSGMQSILNISTSLSTPPGTYALTATATGANGATASAQYTLAVTGFTVSFTETGLPAGTIWSVTLDGKTLSSTSNTISFTNISSDSYNWNVSTPIYEAADTRNVASPPSGTMDVPLATGQSVTYVKQYRLIMAANLGTTSPSLGEHWHNAGTVVQISASAPSVTDGERYAWQGWAGSGLGNYTGTLDPSSATMNGPVNETAAWTHEFRLTVRTIGLGVNTTRVYNETVILGTATDASPYWGWFEDGSSMLVDVDSPISSAQMRFVFTQWIGGATGTARPLLLTLSEAKDVTANYQAQYRIDVTASPSGALGGNFNVSYTQLGVAYASQETTTWAEWADLGTTVTVTAPQGFVPSEAGSAGIRYAFHAYDPSNSVTMSQARTITIVYQAQYLVTFARPVGLDSTAIGTIVTVDTTGRNLTELPFTSWFDAGTTYAFTTVIPSTEPGKRFILDEVAGPPSPLSSPGNVTATYSAQYYLTVSNGGYGTATGEGWYDAGSQAFFSIAPTAVPGLTGVQHVFTAWSGSGAGSYTGPLASQSVKMDNPVSETAQWKTQYYLTVSSPYDTPGGAGWYDGGATAYATLATGTVSAAGTRHAFTGWSGDASGSALTSNAITMDAPKTAFANWKTQYYLSMSANYGTAMPSSGWYDAGSNVTIVASAPSAADGAKYTWLGWTGMGTVSYSGLWNPASVLMNSQITETATWQLEYRLIVSSEHDSPTPPVGEHWYPPGTIVDASVTSPWPIDANDARHVCTGWTGTGSVPASGTATSVRFTMDAPSNLTWNWKTQYYLNVTSPYGTPSGSGWYDAGSTAYGSLEEGGSVQENLAYVFVNWTVDASGNALRTNPIRMDAPKDAVANWTVQYYVFTLDKSPRIGTMMVDNSTFDTFPVVEKWAPGSIHTVSVPAVETGGAGARYVFSQWSDGSTLTDKVVAVEGPGGLTANYGTEYLLSVASEHGTTNGSGWYPSGTVASFSVTPSAVRYEQWGIEYAFMRWHGSGPGISFTGSMNPATAVMTGPVQERAEWEATMFYLDVISEIGEAYGEGWYRKGDTATFGVTSPVDQGNGTMRGLSRWSGDIDTSTAQGSIAMHKPARVVASWGSAYLLIIEAVGVTDPFNARVTLAASLGVEHTLNYTSPLRAWFSAGTLVTTGISTPNKIGHGEWAIFKEWKGDIEGAARSASVLMSAPRTAQAFFFEVNPVAESIPYSLLTGVIILVVLVLATRRRRSEGESKPQRRSTPMASGIAVAALALIVAVLASVWVATGYSIPMDELLDFTNWAVVFTVVEVLVFLFAGTAFTRRRTQTAATAQTQSAGAGSQ